MRFHIRSLKARAAETGRSLTWQEVADGTGISKLTLLKLANNTARVIRPQYVDALCTFFGVGVDELISTEEVPLPLRLELRPDRYGKKVGEPSSKKRSN